ncbi:MFS general substrate transporter [Hortaea werneckii]|nr:MFS general substrate transporter [Hortaea werneckii]
MAYDHQAATAVATDERHSKINSNAIPGTVHLVDLDHQVQGKHAKGHTDIVLVPTPNDDPDDPLNWPRRRKLLSLACMCIYTWFAGIANSVVYSVETPLAEALGITVGDINAGTGYLFLLCGWGLLFWQPFALQYGKRPTYLISVAATLALTMWGPYAASNGQWIAKNVLGGFFSAPIEALPEVSVSDVFFAHERGTFMGVYAFVLAGSNFFAPIICGFINDTLGYQWVFYIPAIFLAFAFVFLFFFLEETNYDRHALVEAKNDAPSRHETPEASPASEKTTVANESPDNSSAEVGTVLHRQKTYLQKLSLKDRRRPQRMPYRCMLSLRLLSWPVIFYAGFSYGSYLIWFNVLNGTASLILGGAPYNFSSSMVGLSYLSCLLGVIAAAVYTGYFSDWMALKLARRNNGIFEPEHRLWGFALPTLVLPASLILWGVGAAHGVHWFGLIVAMFGTAFCNTAGITLSVNYLVDSYHEISGDGMTTVMLIRNTMSFAIGYGITPTAATAALALASRTSAINILVGNDDGFGSAQMIEMVRLLRESGHNVVAVAPVDNQSGMGGRSVFSDLTELATASEYDIVPAGSPALGRAPFIDGVWYYNGTPAACAFVGLDYVLPNFANFTTPDLVVAGPNYGDNLGAFLYTLSGTAGYTYSSVGRGIPAIAFSGGNGEQRSYAWINETTESGYPDPATIQAQLAVDVVNTLVNNTNPGQPLLPQGYGLSVNTPYITSFSNDSCVSPPFIQTRLTGGAVTDIAAYNETSQTFHYEPIVPEGGINACINGDCSLPGETEVVEDSCFGSVSVFTVDYSAPLGEATTNIRQRLTPLVSFQDGGNDTDTGASATSSSSAAAGSTGTPAGGYGWGEKGSKHFGNGWGKGPQHGPPSKHHWNPRYVN